MQSRTAPISKSMVSSRVRENPAPMCGCQEHPADHGWYRLIKAKVLSKHTADNQDGAKPRGNHKSGHAR